MTAFWLNSQNEQLVAAHLADARPAWLWAADSEALIWRNRAAKAYEAARRRQPGDTLVPVARQIGRAVRLGAPLAPSLSRLQFTLGRKPLAETCACTPVLLAGNLAALLVVMTEPLADAALASVAFDADGLVPFLGAARDFVLVGSEGDILVSGGAGAERLTAGQKPVAELTAGAEASRLMLFAEEAFQANAAVEAMPLPASDSLSAMPDDFDAVLQAAPAETDEADTPRNDPEAAEAAATVDSPAEAAPQDTPANQANSSAGLLVLLDRLASHDDLYAPLDERDDLFAPPPAASPEASDAIAPVPADGPASAEATEPVAESPSDDHTTAQAAESVAMPDEAPRPSTLWRVEGRGLRISHHPEDETPVPIEPTQSAMPPAFAEATQRAESATEDGAPDGDGAGAESPPGADTPAADDVIVLDDVEAIERASRYNFDELSRILTGRVFGDGEAARDKAEASDAAAPSSLVGLGDETLILNRLSLGLLVFRDQKILFSNRALSDLLGYDSGTSLRIAGLGGVFPADGDQANVGPVTRLVGADGRIIAVSARLQSISWQGKPALLLSASRQKEGLNAEDLARGFAEIMATALDCGYFETSRAGILTSVSARTANLLHRPADSLVGRPIHGLIALNQGARLRGFLEQPARFAGGERPMLRFVGIEPDTEVVLFAEGMAGIVSGYFGLLRRVGADAATTLPLRNIEPAFLIRLGRAIRQPVNAIVGFAEIIRDQAFGAVGNDRYLDYARFIRAAGQDIAGVVDEIEDYARLGDSETELASSRIDLIDLLETCVARVRPYAGSMRVLVRSGISKNLLPITADPETLSQAVLNLLASAVAHSQSGGQVVLSAQHRADGAVEIHIRDSASSNGAELEERFVVFRDGQSADGETLAPIPSAIGLTLTKSLLAVNACRLEVDPGPGAGTILSLIVPADLVVGADSARK